MKLGGLVVVLGIAGSFSGTWACGKLADEVGKDAAPPEGAEVDAAAVVSFDARVEGGEAAAPDAPTEATPASPAGDGSVTGPTVLVSNVYEARQVAVDDVNVYFTGLSATSDDEGIYQIAKDALETAPILLSGNDGQPLSLASDGAYVYWNDTLDPEAIRRVMVGGNGATTLAAIGVGGMSLGATSLFFVTGDGVESMPKAGGTPTVLAPAPTGAVLAGALDASYFYFAASPSSLSTTISRVLQSGGPVTTLATVGTTVNVLATDGANVYFVSGDELSAVPASGGTVSVLASGFSGSTSLTVDSGSLYASIALGNGPNGSILRVPVAGGTPTIIASAQWVPEDVAVDANYVYWSTFDGQEGPGAIMMAPK
jgi:hypothetical protein